MALDDYSPRYCGDTSRGLSVTFTDHEGNPDNLTGATNFVLKLRNVSNPAQVITGAGAWTITNATAGQATYAFASGDVAQPGLYQLSVSATLADGPAHWDWRIIEFLPVF